MRFAAVVLTIAILIAAMLMLHGPGTPGNAGPTLNEEPSATRSSHPKLPMAVHSPATDDSEASKQPNVAFPNGEIVAITLRKPKEESHPPPIEMLYNHEYFKSLAEHGDVEAQHKLFSAFATCDQLAPVNAGQMENAIGIMYQTRILRMGPDGRRSMLIDDKSDIEKIARDFRRISESCWGIAEEDRRAMSSWLVAAAAGNYVPALMTLGTQFEIGTSTALMSFERAWNLGNIHALQQIALIYQSDRGAIEQDPIRAFAYNYLHKQISIIDHRLHGSDDAERLIREGQENLESLTDELPSYQVEEGLELARQILFDNPNCCVSSYR